MIHYTIPVDVLWYYSYFHQLDLLGKALPRHLHTAIFTSVILYCAVRLGRSLYNIDENRHKRIKRRKEAEKTFEHLLDDFNIAQIPIDPTITQLTIEDLKKKLLDKSLMPSQVLLAYQNQALSVNNETNSIVDMLESPTHNATTLEQLTDVSPKSLYGIPISLKETIQVEALDATCGISTFIGQDAKEDAVIVQILKAQGALPFLRTNVGQGSLLFGSSNPIFGQTLHPLNKNRSPGGSCCGEGALIAGQGSVLGVGMDIGGNLRIPAHFCGVCCLKPTSQRVSCKGLKNLISGQGIVPVCVGPMARTVAGLVIFMESVCIPLQYTLDPHLPALIFNKQVFTSSRLLRIGFFVDDGCTKCVPAVRRAVMDAKVILERLGHLVTPFDPPDMNYMFFKLFLPSVYGDDCYRIIKYMCEDALDPCISSIYYTGQIPHLIRWILSWCLFKRDPSTSLSAMMTLNPPMEIGEWWNLADTVEEFRNLFLKRWKEEELDVLLCPVMPCAAVRLGHESHFTGMLTYTSLFSVLDFPAGTVSVTSVTKHDLDMLQDSTSFEVQTRLEHAMKKNEPGSSSIGLPVSVQCAALPFREELVLRVLAELEKNLGTET